jgi:hypothetical protein
LLGVPAQILGKMVTTPPDQILWLTPDDLRLMGATMTGKPDQTRRPLMSEIQVPSQIPPRDAIARSTMAALQAVDGDANIIANILQTEGYAAKISNDKGGEPFIKTSSQGYKWVILFYGCSNHSHCQSLQFVASFGMNGKGSVGQVNGWNEKMRFASAVVDKDGDLVLRMDIGIGSGISYDVFKWNLSMWDGLLARYVKSIQAN